MTPRGRATQQPQADMLSFWKKMRDNVWKIRDFFKNLFAFFLPHVFRRHQSCREIRWNAYCKPFSTPAACPGRWHNPVKRSCIFCIKIWPASIPYSFFAGLIPGDDSRFTIFVFFLGRLIFILSPHKCKLKKNFFFLGRLILILSPHKCKLWWHYQTIYYHCIVFLLPLNGNSMCNGWFASKFTENVVVLRYNFSLSDCHFSLIVLQGEVTSP